MYKRPSLVTITNKGVSGPTGPPGVPGVPGIWGYCPICGGTDLKISIIPSTNALGEDALFYCYCGWCDTGDQLLTKQQFEIKQRKDKLLKIKNYEN